MKVTEKGCSFPDLMIDIEGLGKEANSVIAQIAARPFNMATGEVCLTYFDAKINIMKAEKAGMVVDSSTVLFWLAQSKDAQDLVFGYDEYQQGGEHPKKVLRDLTDFVNRYSGGEVDLRIWQHTNYDSILLTKAYEILKEDPFFTFRSWKDIRTLSYLSSPVDIEFEGTPHNAINDVDFQIKYCIEMYRQLKGEEL